MSAAADGFKAMAFAVAVVALMFGGQWLTFQQQKAAARAAIREESAKAPRCMPLDAGFQLCTWTEFR